MAAECVAKTFQVAKAKRPSFQFYPGDWRRDVGLQSCSLEARGLWIELMVLMHDGEPYGHLAVNGLALPDADVARIVGVPVPRYRALLKELRAKGVPSDTDGGLLYSRRMVHDEHIRQVRAAAGKTGGENRSANQRFASDIAQAKPQAKGEAKSEQMVADADAEVVGGRSGRGGASPIDRPDAWVDPFAVEWEARIGMAPKPKIALLLRPLIERHGVPQVYAVWQGYVREAKGQKWGSPRHFAETYLAIRERWGTTSDTAGHEFPIPDQPGCLALEVA